MCIGIIIFILHLDFYTNYKRQIIMSLLVIFYFIINHALIDNFASNCSWHLGLKLIITIPASFYVKCEFV